MNDSKMERVKSVKQKYESQWIRIPGVESVGLGLLLDGNPGILIGVSKDQEEMRKVLPESIDAVLVEIFFCGSIEAC